MPEDRMSFKMTVRHSPYLGILLVFGAILAGCGALPEATLPTATPPPVAALPSATPTQLPPPTVTTFPTATLRSGEVVPVTFDPNATLAPVLTAANTEASLPSSGTLSAPVATTAPTSIPVTDTPFPTYTPTATPTSPVAALPDGMVVVDNVFTADFFQGWPSFNDDTAKIAIQQGQYVFKIGPLSARFVNTTVVNRSDMYVQVEVTPKTCSAENGYGLMYRYKDASNYYLFTVFCNKTFTAVARVNGSLLGFLNEYLPADLDPASGTTHIISVAAKGQTMSLFFDGKLVGSFTDNQLTQGDIAVYAASQTTEVVTVAFDNLQVWTVR
jgi:hypothetical protein